MPLQAPADEEYVVRVWDGDSGAPIEGADVFVLDLGSEPADRQRLEALQARIAAKLGPKVLRLEQILAMAVLEGARFRTGADGTVTVALREESAGLIAMHDGVLAASNTRRDEPLRLFAPRWLDVRVVTASGKPAAGVPVGVDRKREAPFDKPFFWLS